MKVSLPMDKESSAAGQSLSCAEFISTSHKICCVMLIKMKTLYFNRQAEYLPAAMGMNRIFVCSGISGLLAPLPDSVGAALRAAMVWLWSDQGRWGRVLIPASRNGKIIAR
ncbi:hypothetical protein [Litchfieldella rifensis]|uniref:Uncharacterized protein n=1 Tax=Litchfieldella rifensis TaxID=762643 RepID=A0ABV7LPK0_9GAMM